MRTYAEIKSKLRNNKEKLKTVGYCCLIFVLGYGTGKGTSVLPIPKTQHSNYTTNQQEKSPGAAVNTKAQKNTPAITPSDLSHCIIKGNISAKGSKIYHVKGGSSYKTVKPEQCFTTEAEAKAAGFKKSSR